MSKAIAVTIALLLGSLALLASPGAASAAPNTQQVQYTYDAGAETFTLYTQGFAPAIVVEVTNESLSVDRVAKSNPVCTAGSTSQLGTYWEQCVYSGIVATSSIDGTISVFDQSLTSGATYRGDTKFGCHQVVRNGCTGSKTIILH